MSFIPPPLRRAMMLVLVSLTAACATKQAAPFPPSDDGLSQARAAQDTPDGARPVVRSASMEVTVQSVPQAVRAAGEITNAAAGYVEECSSQSGGKARLTLRIPEHRLNESLERLAELGEETSRHVSARDVADSMSDLQATLANKRALRDRLRALLERTHDVKDALAVEAELTRVQTEIDSLEARLTTLRGSVGLAAVDLDLYPPRPPEPRRILGPLGYLFVGTKWFITKLFVIRPGV